MVRMETIQGEGYDTKVAVSWEPLVQFTSEFDTMYLGVCPTTRCIVFMAMMSWGVYGCVKCIEGAFLA